MGNRQSHKLASIKHVIKHDEPSRTSLLSSDLLVSFQATQPRLGKRKAAELMSQFWSLDDDEESARAGESSQMGASLNAFSPSSRSHSTFRDNVQASSSRTFQALIDEPDLSDDLGAERIGGSKSSRNGINSKEAPVMQLQRAWISERGCPEILAWKGNAIDDVCSQIEEQMVSFKVLSFSKV